MKEAVVPVSAEAAVLDQLVGVGRHEGDRLRFDVDVHAVHHRAELVVGRRENRFVDARKQQVRVDGDFLFRLFVERGLRRVAQSGSAGNGQLARFPADLDLPTSTRWPRSSAVAPRTLSANRSSV